MRTSASSDKRRALAAAVAPPATPPTMTRRKLLRLVVKGRQVTRGRHEGARSMANLAIMLHCSDFQELPAEFCSPSEQAQLALCARVLSQQERRARNGGAHRGTWRPSAACGGAPANGRAPARQRPLSATSQHLIAPSWSPHVH